MAMSDTIMEFKNNLLCTFTIAWNSLRFWFKVQSLQYQNTKKTPFQYSNTTLRKEFNSNKKQDMNENCGGPSKNVVVTH